MQRPTVLVIDDDSTFLDSVSFVLKDSLEVVCASGVYEGDEILKKTSVDVIVTDYKMNSGDGHEIVAIAETMNPSPPVILITAYADKDLAIRSANLHVFAFLEKPVNLKALTDSIERAIQAKTPTEVVSRCECSNISAEEVIKLDENDYSVSFQGERFALTKIEFCILSVFSESAGKRIDRDDIMKRVWGSAKMSPNLFDTHLRNIRKKLPFLSQRLKSIWGSGYIFQ